MHILLPLEQTFYYIFCYRLYTFILPLWWISDSLNKDSCYFRLYQASHHQVILPLRRLLFRGETTEEKMSWIELSSMNYNACLRTAICFFGACGEGAGYCVFGLTLEKLSKKILKKKKETMLFWARLSSNFASYKYNLKKQMKYVAMLAIETVQKAD